MQLNLNDLSIAKAFKEKALAANFVFNENYANDTVIQAFDTEPEVVYSPEQVSFFVPGTSSFDEYSPSQLVDNKLCRFDQYFMTRVLNFEYGSIPKKQNWFGLESRSLCQWEATYRDYFDENYDATRMETNICNIDVAYIECQNWYKTQAANRRQPTVTTLSFYGQSAQKAKALELITCESILRPEDKSFYGAVCST